MPSRAPDEPWTIESALDDLQRGAARWIATPFAGRADLLAACRANLVAQAGRWVELACALKHAGLPAALRARLAGEEVAGGPLATARHLRLLETTHRHLAAGGLPPLPGAATAAGVPVFPTDTCLDALLFRGFRASVRVDPAHPEIQRPPPLGGPSRGVCLVLGAGNVTSLPVTDALHQVFHESRAVLLKLSPLHDALLPVFSATLAPLIRAGVLRIVTGDADVGRALAHHDLVDAVHLTGSAATAARLQRGADAIAKPLTCELGGATPVLVLPGRFSPRALRFHAMNVATMLVNNASFNCAAAQVLVTHAGWSQRRAFLDALDSVLAKTPTRPAWYPGAAGRFRRFCPDAALVGGHPPWIVQRSVQTSPPSPFLTEELFAGALGEVSLPAPDGNAFQRDATAFLNEHVHGDLGTTVLAPPDTDPGYAIENLRYGTIGVNHWCALGYALMSPPWGAYAGGVGAGASGRGFVHNTYLLAAPRKTVLTGPFLPRPLPSWFADHRHGTGALWALCRYYLDGRRRRVASILWHGLRA